VIDERLVAAVGGRELGVHVHAMERISGFVGNEDFRLHTDVGDFIVKAADAATVGSEAWACARVLREGVAAPEVIAVNLEAGTLGRPYLIERALPGQPSDAAAVLREAGRQLRRVHAIEAPGYGFCNEGDDIGRGPYQSWAAAVGAAVEDLDRLVAPGLLEGGVAVRLRSLVTAELIDLDAAAGRLLHGDLLPRHVFADPDQGGRFTGIIDWGDVAVGDPLFDLGRFARAAPAALTALLHGYGLDATASERRRIVFYRTVWSVLALGWEFDAGGDWFAGHLAAIDEGLAQLGN
jgi:aminoglycoside phosphotransferase (APT) family kinase protein